MRQQLQPSHRLQQPSSPKQHLQCQTPSQTHFQQVALYYFRIKLVAAILLAVVAGLIARIFYLGVYHQPFLHKQGAIRSVRAVNYKARGRGVIVDRNGEPVAISVPSSLIWADPKLYKANDQQERQLAQLLELTVERLRTKFASHQRSRFVYLRRHLSPASGQQIMQLKIPGIYYRQTYQRKYPEGQVLAPVLGITDIDDDGREGVELLYNGWLSARSGKLQILKDCLGNVVNYLRQLRVPDGGRNLQLSIDNRIQRTVFEELTNTIRQFSAESGSVVVLSVKTGEILAMVNAPSYDPNDRQHHLEKVKYLRNRVVTDLFEPGSTAKIFTMAAALKSKRFTPSTPVDTNPGVFYVGRHAIYDALNINNGVLTLSEVLQKSSDIGTAKIALQLPDDLLLDNLRSFRLGQVTPLAFPGERAGNLPSSLRNRALVTATLSFGYAFNATLLQMAQAYAMIANCGVWQPITLLKRSVNKEINGAISGTARDMADDATRDISSDQGLIEWQRGLPRGLANQLLQMLEKCISETKKHPAAVPGYRVAGKTGTAHLSAGKRGYHANRYCASFIGIAPVTRPEIVVAIVIRDPKGEHFGGKVAAPLFGKVAGKILHLLNVPFDRVDEAPAASNVQSDRNIRAAD